MRTGRILCGLIAAACIAIEVPLLSQSPQWGIVTQVYTPAFDNKVNLLDAGSVRLVFRWNEVEPAQDQWNWAPFDDQVNRAVGRGLHVYVSMGENTPAWAGPAGNQMPYSINDWRDFVARIIERYGDRPNIAFGVWNEPNLGQFLVDNGSATNWGQLFAYANIARNQVRPSARLGGPDTSWHALGTGYLTNAIAQAAPHTQPQDFITVHWYGASGTSMTNYVASVRSLIGAGREIWVTEAGFDSSSDTAQSNGLAAQVLAPFAVRTDPGWTKAFVYQLAGHHWWFLVNPDWSLRQSFWTYRNYATNWVQGTTYQVNLRAANGMYLMADGGGGSTLSATGAAPGPWERISFTDANGGVAESGDIVFLQAPSGHAWLAQNGGGQGVNVTGTGTGQYDVFEVVRAAGPGPIGPGDQLAFRALHGQFVQALNGGGSGVAAIGGAIGAWELFVISGAP
jgi:hypothetical protein